MSNTELKEIDVLESRLQDLEKEYIQKIRKLKKHSRAAQARAYVQKRLKEEAELHVTGSTCVRLQASSCKKAPSKSTKALTTKYDMKERRKSLSSLKHDNSAAGHQKTSRLEPMDYKAEQQTLTVSKCEDSSLKPESSDNSLKSTRLCGKLLESKDLNEQRLSRKNQKYTLKYQHEKKVIVDKHSSDPTIPAKSEQKIEINNAASMIVQKHNPKIPVESKLSLSSETVNISKDINGSKTNAEQIDAAYESSEDMFTSTPKDIDEKDNSKTYKDIDPVNDSDSDQVIIVSSHGELLRNEENLRNKNQLSKLKLSKYKKKNFVNPVRVDKMCVEEKENLVIVRESETQVPGVSQKELEWPDKGNVIDVDKVEKEVSELKVEDKSSSQSKKEVSANSTSEQGAVYSEGQVIVFERQIRKTNQVVKASKPSKKRTDVKRSSKSQEDSVAHFSIESSLSTVCDTEFGEGIEENPKIRRRSGSRKRRSSGLEAQRRSSRIAGHSSQDSWSQSTETEGISPVFVAAGESAAKKRVIISSMFQCLVDEGRRRSDIEEFNIPTDVLELSRRLTRVPGKTDTDFDNDLNSSYSTNKAHNSELGIREEKAVNKDQTNIKTEFLGESSEVKLKDIELPGTETYDVNLLEKDDVISPTLFESQPNNSNIFSFSKEKLIDNIGYNKSLNKDNDMLNEEDNLINKGKEELNNRNEQVIMQIDNLNKENEHLNNANEQMLKENDNTNKENEFKNEGNEEYNLENELGNKESEVLSKEDVDKCLAESITLDHEHHIQNVNIDNDTDRNNSSSLHLRQIGAFEVPKCDNVHSILCVEVPCNDNMQPYVVCLCSSCLKLYTICNNQWTCLANTKLGFTTRKKSGNLMYSLPETDNVSVVLLGIKSGCTCINLYTYAKQTWQKITLDQVYSKSIQVCPLSSRVIVVSYYTDERSYLCRYVQDISSGQWSTLQLDSTEKHITHLIPVRGIQDAVLAFTKMNEIQIWNHDHGYLLTTVDMSDFCPPEPICTLGFAEQGFLFVPVLSKKKGKEAGTVVVINPSMNTSEPLTPISIPDTSSWTGCSGVGNMSDGILLCRQNNGCIRLWDVYTGGLLATIDDVTVTCFSATNQHLVAAHKHCVHLYKLNIPSLS